MKRDITKKSSATERNITDKDEEGTEPVRIENRRARGKWKDSHVVRLVLLIVVAILFAGGGIFYLFGRFCPSSGGFLGVDLLYLIASVFVLWCFISGIVRLVRSCRGQRTRKKVLLILAKTAVPLVYVGLILAPYLFPLQRFSGRFYELFALGLRDRIESKADIEATRAWLQSLPAEEYEEYKGGDQIPSAKLPEALRVLQDGDVRISLSADANANTMVELMWGSAVMGHWGAMIGMKDMETPPSDFRFGGSYILPVEPGAYVWWRVE